MTRRNNPIRKKTIRPLEVQLELKHRGHRGDFEQGARGLPTRQQAVTVRCIRDWQLDCRVCGFCRYRVAGNRLTQDHHRSGTASTLDGTADLPPLGSKALRLEGPV